MRSVVSGAVVDRKPKVDDSNQEAHVDDTKNGKAHLWLLHTLKMEYMNAKGKEVDVFMKEYLRNRKRRPYANASSQWGPRMRQKRRLNL